MAQQHAHWKTFGRALATSLLLAYNARGAPTRSGGMRPENARIRRSSNRPERILALSAYWPTCSQVALTDFAGVYVALCVGPVHVFARGVSVGPLSLPGIEMFPALALLLSPPPPCGLTGVDEALVAGGASGRGAAVAGAG